MNIGKYPQSVVLDDTLISKLNKVVIPNKRGYYEYDGKEYAKVTANPYRNNCKFSDNKTHIISGNEYFFLVEQIEWRVLSGISSDCYYITEKVIDNKMYYPNIDEIRIIENKRIMPNNYAFSTIRGWLNNDFYNKAFTDKEKEQIEEILIDNISRVIKENDTISGFFDNYNPITYDYNTLDKVFLLSYYEMMNDVYTSELNQTKEVSVTDYARATGSLIFGDYGSGYWWIRTTDVYDDQYAGYGFINVNTHTTPVNSNYMGIRPVIKVIKTN